MKELRTVNVDNNNYHIFKVESKEGILEVYFIWGKTDFRSTWAQNQENWVKTNLEIFKNSRWYSYQKVSHHGISQDEVHWKHQNEDLFIELPKNFNDVSVEIFKKISSNYYLK